MKKLPVGLELEATGMAWDRRKVFSRRAGGPSVACKKGIGKASPGFLSALPPTCWVTLGKPLNLSGPLSLSFPFWLSVGSGSVCPYFVFIEEWLG